MLDVDSRRAIADQQSPDGVLRLTKPSLVITFGEPMNGSTGQPFIHAKWEAFAIGQKQSSSYPCEDGKIQGRLHS